MRRLRCASQLSVLAPVLFGTGLMPAADQAASTKVEIKVVKYDALQIIITQFQGKVVVGDYWSET